MDSEETLARYEKLINQQAQEAAVINILGPAAGQRRTLNHPDTALRCNLTAPVLSGNLSNLVGQQIDTQVGQILNTRSNNGNISHGSESSGSPSGILGEELAADLVETRDDIQTGKYRKCPSTRKRPAADREEKYKCKLCPYRSKWSHGLSNHMRTHNNTVFRCEHCVYSTAWKGDLTNHLRVHTGNMFTCDKCDFQTYRKQGLQKHMRMHNGDKPHKCSLCSYSTCELGNLKKHMMRHTNEKPIGCDLCSYKCRQTTQLKLHVLMHHKEVPDNSSEETGSADPTDAVTERVSDVPSVTISSRIAKRSLRRPFSKNRKYTCLLCRLSWMSRRSYTKHMFSKHSSTAFHKCGFICEKSFLTAAECERHKATHAHPFVKSQPSKCDASTCTSLDEITEESPLNQSKPPSNQSDVLKSNLQVPVDMCPNAISSLVSSSQLTDIPGYSPDMIDPTLSYHDFSSIQFDCNVVLSDQPSPLVGDQPTNDSLSNITQSESVQKLDIMPTVHHS
ncbi:zinc finger protein 64-like [Watersipora subatra]|uniref:zinc finger protein 64-like n=1 Tax=Watersipora subatra TaxID=2589382 RepID=UPI00355C58F9